VTIDQSGKKKSRTEERNKMPKTKTQIVMLGLLYILFVIAGTAFGWVVAFGSVTMTLSRIQVGSAELSLAARLDSLSTIVLLMVSFLGIVIGQYSVRYLDGEKRQDFFFRYLCFTVFSVAAFVTASSLITLFFAWLAISFGLHQLLLFYPERPGAVQAAQKKFLVSRLGDVFLLIGILLVYRAFGTFEFQTIFALSQGVLTERQSELLACSGLFVVFGAMTKSAQFPFHFWLPETMETPTPVSALMHAGIINGGGFLLIRLNPLIAHASFASLVLAVAGALTGVYASLVMVTQNDIKRKLAYSTISQMGLMMFACGIGAYTFALFHIVAHSLYKAHAFLSTGDLVEESKMISLKIAPQGLWRRLFFTSFGLLLILFGLKWESGRYVPELTYLSVLLLGLSQNSERFEELKTKSTLVISIVVSALVVSISGYALLERIIHAFSESEIVLWRENIGLGSPLFIICIAGYLTFAAGFYLANGLIEPKTKSQKQLYIYLWNGGYFQLRSQRMLRAFEPLFRNESGRIK
jgi:NAD(P)H-quinone oxidoreductase subunit 5